MCRGWLEPKDTNSLSPLQMEILYTGIDLWVDMHRNEFYVCPHEICVMFFSLDAMVPKFLHEIWELDKSGKGGWNRKPTPAAEGGTVVLGSSLRSPLSLGKPHYFLGIDFLAQHGVQDTAEQNSHTPPTPVPPLYNPPPSPLRPHRHPAIAPASGISFCRCWANYHNHAL